MGFESFNHSVSGTMGSTINSTYVPMDGNGIVIPPAADGGHFNLPGYAPFGEINTITPFAASNIKGGILLGAGPDESGEDGDGGGILPPPPGWLDPEAQLPVGDPVLPLLIFATACFLITKRKLNKLRKAENNQ